MHQNKPVAEITYLNDKGDKVLVADMPCKDVHTFMSLNLEELAILQTCLNRSYFNCNCNLNKDVLKSILAKIKTSLKEYQK
jgi:hypothetical protein